MSDSPLQNSEKTSIWRILDVNCNRATEACRVLEECCRFHLNSEALATTAKNLRHGISISLQDLVNANDVSPLAHRDTDHDVGTDISASDEFHRDSIGQLLSANFSRLQQSLRTMEEYCKALPVAGHESPTAVAAVAFEHARYESYQLQKMLFHVQRGNEVLADCLLCVLTDGANDAGAFQQRIEILLDAGVDMIQLRDRKLDSRELLDRAVTARRRTLAAGKLLIINDRPDICELAAADGVHVGQTDLPVAECRRIVGEKLVGVSTHSVADATQAVRDGADYIGVGPMFASTTKQFAELKGCDLLREVSNAVDLPAFAIGGIDQANIDLIIAASGSRVAVAGGILNAADPAKAALAIRQRLAASRVAAASP